MNMKLFLMKRNKKTKRNNNFPTFIDVYLSLCSDYRKKTCQSVFLKCFINFLPFCEFCRDGLFATLDAIYIHQFGLTSRVRFLIS